MSSYQSVSTSHRPAPSSLADCQIPLSVLEELLIKHLYPRGCATAAELSREVRLPNSVVQEIIVSLLSEEWIARQSSSSGIPPDQQSVELTPRGRRRACDAFDTSRYLGPAPVSVADYIEQCGRQRWDGSGASEEELSSLLSGVSLSEETLSELRWVLAAGGSLLLNGCSGNGKSLLAERLGQFVEQSSEAIAVPYAIWADGVIVRVFDPSTHHPVEVRNGPPASSEPVDLRWRYVRRPVVRVGAELTRESFELASTNHGNTPRVPFHILANGGLLIVDDLGRQTGQFVDLMNRWLLPLERQRDLLLWPSGKRQELPVDAWTILIAGEDAPAIPLPIARRIPCRLHLPAPDRVRFASLLFEEGRKQQMEVDESGVEQLFNHCYNPQNPPKCSDPQNLLQAVESICRIQKETVRARADLLLSAARRLGLDGEQRAA